MRYAAKWSLQARARCGRAILERLVACGEDALGYSGDALQVERLFDGDSVVLADEDGFLAVGRGDADRPVVFVHVLDGVVGALSECRGTHRGRACPLVLEFVLSSVRDDARFCNCL